MLTAEACGVHRDFAEVGISQTERAFDEIGTLSHSQFTHAASRKSPWTTPEPTDMIRGEYFSKRPLPWDSQQKPSFVED
jgi:hypothetical protein